MAPGDAAVKEKRLAQEKVGRTLGVDIGDLDAFERQLHISEDGTLDCSEKPAHLLANFADIRDMRESTAAELRHFGGEEEVRGTADGDGVETSTAQVAVQRSKDLLFVAKVAIRKEDNVAQVARCFGLPHDVKQRGKHLRASACFKVLDKAARSRDIFRGGSQRLGGKLMVSVVESKDAELIAGAETVESLEQRFASLSDGSPTHGAGNVNHVQHLHGDALGGLHARRKGREQEIGFA